MPNHLYHYAPSTLEKILLVGGWRMEKVIHQRTLRNLISSFGYVLKSKGFNLIGDALVKVPGWLLAPLFPVAFLLACFGQTGRMTVWARPIK